MLLFFSFLACSFIKLTVAAYKVPAFVEHQDKNSDAENRSLAPQSSDLSFASPDEEEGCLLQLPLQNTLTRHARSSGDQSKTIHGRVSSTIVQDTLIHRSRIVSFANVANHPWKWVWREAAIVAGCTAAFILVCVMFACVTVFLLAQRSGTAAEQNLKERVKKASSSTKRRGSQDPFPEPSKIMTAKLGTKRPTASTGELATSTSEMSETQSEAPSEVQSEVQSGVDTLGSSSETNSDASVTNVRYDQPTYGTVFFASAIYAPYQLLVLIIWTLLFVLQQVVVLPFRICGGRPLVFVLNLFAPLMACITFVFLTTNQCEPCYGRNIRDFRTMEDFLQACGARRRKNIKRNRLAADKMLKAQGIKVTYSPAGTWAITSELRDLIWQHCVRHTERARGYADLINCMQPISPRVMYMGELILILTFACDIQMFFDQEGKLVSFNTRVHTGGVYFNPNYGTREDHSRDGIYAWSHYELVEEAIKLRANMVNLMPSMRRAKRALAQQSLPLAALLYECLNLYRRPEPVIEEETQPEPPSLMLGKKRSARKRAARAAAAEALAVVIEDAPNASHRGSVENSV